MVDLLFIRNVHYFFISYCLLWFIDVAVWWSVTIYFQHEAQLVEDKEEALPDFAPATCNFGSSEDDFMDPYDTANCHPRARPIVFHSRSTDSKLVMVPAGFMMRDLKRRPLPNGWLRKRVCSLQPILFFFSLFSCDCTKVSEVAQTEVQLVV